MGVVSKDKAGVGSAVNDATRLLGGTLGVAVIGSVYASLYSSRLASALPAHVQYYQRLLAADQNEARQILEECLKEKPVTELYGSVVIPALGLAEQDRHSKVLDQETQDFIYQSTREIIEELEPVRRGIYGGSVLYADFAGNLDSCIAIRTMLMKGKQAYLQAGAGIVADSDPAKEFQEAMNKAQAVLRAVEMARVGG